MEITGVVRRYADYADGVEALEIRIESEKDKARVAELGSITLSVGGQRYQAEMHPARANRYAWIGPKLTGSDGNGTKLGYVLPPGGFLKNQRVSLEVSGTAVAIRPVAPATISELEQIRAANEVDGDFNPSDLKDARRRILASIALRQGRSASRERIVVAYRSVFRGNWLRCRPST